MVSTVSSVYMAGRFVAAALAGQLADRLARRSVLKSNLMSRSTYIIIFLINISHNIIISHLALLGYMHCRVGRRIVVICFGFLVIIVGTANAFMPTYATYVPVRFLLAVCVSSKAIAAYVLGNTHIHCSVFKI